MIGPATRGVAVVLDRREGERVSAEPAYRTLLWPTIRLSDLFRAHPGTDA